MFRLNRLTDYGVVILSWMDQRRGTLMTAPQLAMDTGIPQPTVAKILNMLAHRDILESQRGVAGGYALMRPADQVHMAEIVQALEGPIALTACVEGSGSDCEVESVCPMRGNWNKVNSAIYRALRDVTLADMAPAEIDFLSRDDASARPNEAAG